MKDNLHLLYRDALNRLHLEVLSMRRNHTFVEYGMCYSFAMTVEQITKRDDIRLNLVDIFDADLGTFFGSGFLIRGQVVEDHTNENIVTELWYPPKAYATRLKFINWAIANVEAKLENAK